MKSSIPAVVGLYCAYAYSAVLMFSCVVPGIFNIPHRMTTMVSACLSLLITVVLVSTTLLYCKK
ncbi:hypothetical protein C3920_13950 [Novacetimonas pomaceti]|uniref:Uncharacterized protein n=1 Tax=Novacetimonas pomaceti TaxID=2021998 RepID=A0A318QJ21_9PROT|nr:hypothetical protein C3920_13950 [Novacetimonas pomaceti]PYD75349.1 hypothetical protein CFR71_09635 [Novacetimonas pomaceti]